MRVNGLEIDVLRARTVVVGSGCAGLNAADWLAALGETEVLLVTDGMNRGTSRNAGSDKQTYYKLSLSGDKSDSVAAMTATLLAEGVNGDTALCEAAGSAQAFFKLVQLGVAFPTNRYGEFVGYQTDHDTAGRATSAGPLTSKQMTEALERQVRARGIPVLDRTTAFAVLTQEKRVAGLLCLAHAERQLKLILAAHVILATGGPAQIYEASVFPESQQGMTGLAVAAGARLANLQHWQYGLASVAFRWNVSGSYQQVLPRYVSVDAEGREREFLNEAFADDPMEGVRRAFLKGYQWPFDVRKVDGSSRIDLLVQRENALGRRVYLDFRRNPSPLKADFSNLDAEARTYLEKTGALQATPYARLMHMNAPAVELYRAHGIDLEQEMLEIRVCAQHHNGGIAVDADWQTNITGLYAAGEAAGTFGAYRPGGSALNATQVGSMRAAQHIAWDSPLQAAEDAEDLRPEIEAALSGLRYPGDVRETAARFRRAMSAYGAHLRDLAALERLDGELQAALETGKGQFEANLPEDFEERLRLRDQMMTQRAVISAMRAAAEVFGSSGAGLVLDGEDFRPTREQAESLVLYTERRGGEYLSYTEPARPVPEGEHWFENAWREFRERTERLSSL